MQFNPTDKSQSIIAHIDFLLWADGSTFNDRFSLIDRTRAVNIAWDEAISELYKADPNFRWDDTTNDDFPIATINLSAGLDHYTMLDSALVIHRVRMKDRNGVFKTLEPVLRRELNDYQLRATGEPETYYKIGGAIFPNPIPDYSAEGGVELEFQRGANHFSTTDVAVSPGFNSQFHHFLPVCAALEFAMANDMDSKVNMLSVKKEMIRNQMREYYERRSPDERPRLSLKKKSTNRYAI